MVVDRGLVFRLGSIGFLLDLVDVIEVVEQVSDSLDSSSSVIGLGIVSALEFRQTWIPVVDPTLRLDISSSIKMKDKVAVILRGSEGSWALLVDKVEEMAAACDFVSCEIPFLLKVSAMEFYSQIKLLHGEPLIVFEPELYYGSAAVAV